LKAQKIFSYFADINKLEGTWKRTENDEKDGIRACAETSAIQKTLCEKLRMESALEE
jgi:hypothetical protein